jgi:hypothetical protein
MQRLRDPNWILIFVFVAIIVAAPLIQIALEVRQDEGVIALDLFSEPPTAEHLRAFEHKLGESSWAARLSRPLVQFAQFAWLKYGGEKVVVGSRGWYFFKPGLNYMLARPDARPPNATNDPVAAIVDFRDQLAAQGIHLILMPVPNKDSVYPDRLTSRAENLHAVMSPRTQQILQRLRAANVEVLDLFKEFSQARNQNASNAEIPLYLAQDTHWSPAGVDLAAKTLARRLTALNWVQPGRVDYDEKPAPVPRLGDILRMLQTPRIERTIAPENVPAVQIIRGQDDQFYKDDPNSELLVLGDSFMRIYQTDQPNAAGFIAHLAKELKQPVLSLVNDGGGSTLVREELCAQPIYLRNKKVVVWEFVERDLGLGIKGWKRTQLPAKPPATPP